MKAEMKLKPRGRERTWLIRKVRPRCTYCNVAMTKTRKGKPPRDTDATLDHAIPVSMGGTDHQDNLAPCCRKCNQEKGPMTAEMFARWRANRAGGPLPPPGPLPPVEAGLVVPCLVKPADPAALPVWSGAKPKAKGKSKATPKPDDPPFIPGPATYDGPLPDTVEAANGRLAELKSEITGLVAEAFGIKGSRATALYRRIGALVAERKAINIHRFEMLRAIRERSRADGPAHLPKFLAGPATGTRAERYRARMLSAWKASGVADPDDARQLVLAAIHAMVRMNRRLGFEWESQDEAVKCLLEHYASPMNGNPVEFRDDGAS